MRNATIRYAATRVCVNRRFCGPEHTGRYYVATKFSPVMVKRDDGWWAAERPGWTETVRAGAYSTR